MTKTQSLFAVALLFFCTALPLFADEVQQKKLYHGGIYGQTFELTEYSNGKECSLELFMTDDGAKDVQKFDPNLPTVYRIYSKWFSNPSEYSRAIDASKDFFEKTMVLVYLADMKDICDLAPCCKPSEYKIATARDGRKYIYIQYECSDLEWLFEFAGAYTAFGREYVMEKYLK